MFHFYSKNKMLWSCLMIHLWLGESGLYALLVKTQWKKKRFEFSFNSGIQGGKELLQVSSFKAKGRWASKHWHTHSLLGYSLIDTAPLDIDQVLPSCCSHTCLLWATWLERIKALINLGCSFPFKTSPPLALICLHCIWSLVRLLTAPLN